MVCLAEILENRLRAPLWAHILYKPNTICEVAAKFGISTSRLMDLRGGAAINREDTQCSKMLKAEKKEEAEGKTPTRSRAASPEEQSTPQPSTSKK